MNKKEQSEQDKFRYMKQALLEADLAEKNDDVPVGAVIVHQGEIISRAHNQREILKDTTAHAEILAIKQACEKLNTWILDECDLYVTLEPCTMCFGAIIQARIANVFFGAFDPKTGACGSVDEIANLKDSKLNHHTVFSGGILEKECSNKLKLFFQKKRNSAKLERINKQQINN